MANLAKRLPDNVPGEFYVDSTCIDCDTCRQLAPEVFVEHGDFSIVAHQPDTAGQRREALRALLACPTSSIGTLHRNEAREVMQDFPLLIENNVYYLGFNSEKSFGGNSYFIQDPAGNWMVDAPRFLPHMVKRIDAMGGLKWIFLTHRDDVADAAAYAKKFGARRIIHRDDLKAAPEAEEILAGIEPKVLQSGYLAIPTPGHTRGHSVLLYRNRYLFSGDHLWFSRKTGRLGASHSVCWYSWAEQIHSMERLLNHPFEWVLPGHGRRGQLSATRMRQALSQLVAQMRAIS